MRTVTWNRNGIHLTFLQGMSCVATSNARATGERAGVNMTMGGILSRSRRRSVAGRGGKEMLFHDANRQITQMIRVQLADDSRSG
jgi:hypothetical protein